MNDSTRRDASRPDRLPDVSPSRSEGRYTRFLVPSAERATQQPTSPPIDEPAWWEVDEVAALPDARRWRAGSIITSRLPLVVRTALDTTDRRQPAWGSDRSLTGDLETILGGSRYGRDDPAPVWTDADTVLERASWRDDATPGSGERRPKRGKRNRQERQNDRRRDHGAS